MAKTPKKSTSMRPPKRARNGAVKSSKETEDTDILDEIDDDDGEAAEDAELSIMIQEHVGKRQARKALEHSSAFQHQKDAIFTAARKNSKEISRAGTAYIEDAQTKIQELKAQELSHEKPFKDTERLCTFQQASINSLLSVYPALLGDLAARRSDLVNAASEMLQNNPSRRQAALRKFSKNARMHCEEVKETEKVASDASALIKQYKNLLYM